MKKSKLRIGKKIKSVIALLMCVTLFASCYGGFLSKETIVSPGEGNIVINEPPARSDHDQEQWYQSSETKTFVNGYVETEGDGVKLSQLTSSGFYLILTTEYASVDADDNEDTSSSIMEEVNKIVVLSEDDYSIVDTITIDKDILQVGTDMISYCEIIVKDGTPYLEVVFFDILLNVLTSQFYPINIAQRDLGPMTPLLGADLSARIILDSFLVNEMTCFVAKNGDNIENQSCYLYFYIENEIDPLVVDLSAVMGEPIQSVENIVLLSDDDYLVRYSCTDSNETHTRTLNLSTQSQGTSVFSRAFEDAKDIIEIDSGRLCLIYEDGIYYYYPFTDSFQRIVDFGRCVDFDLTLSNNLMLLDTNGNIIHALALLEDYASGQAYLEVVTLTPIEFPYVGREEVVIGFCGDVSSEISGAMNSYNDSNYAWYVRGMYITTNGPSPILDMPNSYFDENNYSSDVSDTSYIEYLFGRCEYIRTLQSLLTSSQTPDVIVTTSCIPQINNSEYLTNLDSLFNSSTGVDISNLFENVIDLSRVDNNIFLMPISFSLVGIADDEAAPDGGYTYESYCSQFASEDPIANSYWLQQYTELMLSSGHADFVQYDYPRQLMLDFMANDVYPLYSQYFSAEPLSHYYGESSSSIVTIHNIFEYNSLITSRDYYLNGLPSVVSTAAAIDPENLLGISCNSECIYGAFSFTASLLMSDSSNSYENGSISIVREAFETEFEGLDGLPENCYTQMLQSIQNAGDYLIDDPELYLVFAQEIPYFISGARTNEETADMIIGRLLP